jgi:hypothetical protein
MAFTHGALLFTHIARYIIDLIIFKVYQYDTCEKEDMKVYFRETVRNEVQLVHKELEMAKIEIRVMEAKRNWWR